MVEYKPNSYRSKEMPSEKTETRPKMNKVVSGKVLSKKKSGLRKFTDLLVAEDFATMRRYLLTDVLIPKTKEMIDEGMHRILYGEDGSSKRRSANRTPYRSYYEKQNDPPRVANCRTGYELDDIILATRGDAEMVLSQMDDIVEHYGTVSVSDLYDLVGMTGNYTDCKYGWTTNIRNASVVRAHGDGYMLKLPRPMPLD